MILFHWLWDAVALLPQEHAPFLPTALSILMIAQVVLGLVILVKSSNHKAEDVVSSAA